MIITIDGPDGSGKTTISKELEKILKNAGIKVEYKKMELGIENLLLSKLMYRFVRTFNKTKREIYKEKYGEVLLGKRKGSLKERIISSFIILDKTLTVAYTKFKYRKTMLILDAYIYDNLVPFYCRKLIPSTLYEFVLSLRPFIRGDIEIFLDAPTEKLFKRRVGIDYDSIQFVECNRKHFRECAEKMKSPVVHVNLPVNKTICKVLNAILNQLPGYNKEEHLLHLLSDPFFREKPKEYKDKIIETFDFDKIRWDKVLKAAEKQKVLLPLLHNLMMLKTKRSLKETFKNKLNEVLKERDRRLKLIKEVTELFNENNVNYAIFKSIPPFNSELDSDIDVLIDSHDVPKAIDLLKKVFWTEQHLILERKIDRIYSFLYPSLVLYKKGFEIDFHDTVTWGKFWISTDGVKNILKNRREVKFKGIRVYILPDEYEFIFTILHALYKHNRINLWDIHIVRSFLKKSINIRKIHKISEEFRVSSSVNFFLDVYRTKNIFYWKDNLLNPTYSSNYFFRNFGELITLSEIVTSKTRRVIKEGLYNFFIELIPGLRQPGRLYDMYKNKLK